MKKRLSRRPVRASARARGVGVFAALSAALAGCASYTPEPLTPQAALHAARARTLDDPALVADVVAHLPPGAPLPPTWTFESLLRAAYRFNPGLAVARARLGVARAGEVTAAERPNPTVSVPFEDTTNAKSGDSPYLLGLALDIPIETGDKRAARRVRAAEATRATRFELGEAAWQVRSRLHTALLDLLHARRSDALFDAQAARRSRMADLVARRVAVGDAARGDALRAQAALSRLREQQASAQAAVTQAQSEVARVVGVPLATLAHADLRLDTLDRLPPDAPSGRLMDAALENRADVQAALARYEESQGALRLAVARQYPDIHLGPGYTFDAGAHKLVMSVSGIELPLFNQHRGEIAEAEARRREAAARVEAVVAQGLAQVEAADAALRGARVRWSLAEGRARSEQALAAAARRSFQAGDIGRPDLIRAELQAGDADLAREDARDALLRAAAALEDAVQRPLTDAPPPTIEAPR